MAPGAALDVVGTGPATDTLEVGFEDDSVIVWGWPGSLIRLFQGDLELGNSQNRPLVPTGELPIPTDEPA